VPTSQLQRLPKNEGVSVALQVASDKGLETFELGNRRYLGGKSKLLPWIENEIHSALARKPRSFFDVFAGTGVVGYHFAKLGIPIAASDLLLHNYFGLQTFMEPASLNIESLGEKLLHLQTLKGKKNYFSEHFGNNYFSLDNAKLIGSVREEIDVISTSAHERAALITSLIYATDRVANTVGHYDAFHRRQKIVSPIKLKLPLINEKMNKENTTYCEDSLHVAGKISVDVAYLDPPYNSRQYSDAYHLLENLAAWEKPEVKGVARKMDRTHLKSNFCGKSAPEAFDEIVQRLSARLIVVSYNNTNESLNSRSNAAISDESLINSLRRRGPVITREMAFNGFTTGKTEKRNHTERLFICKVLK
jgi:adenine-specific DNA-methyltransferase